MSNRALILHEDIDAILDDFGDAWAALDGARLFMTGGTGFIGRWMLEALYAAQKTRGMFCDVVVLSRNPEAFANRAPHLVAHPAFYFIHGQISDGLTVDGPITHILHAATDASADLNEREPRRMFDTVVDGTRRTLDLARAKGTSRYLYFSSGAIYGPQPWDITHVSEEWRGGPDCRDPRAAYAEGKRAAEMLCAIYAKQFGLDIVTARIFALLGPMLSLDIHFAAGNFIRDALAGRTIRVEGAGLAERSYLYAGDLTHWLWALLLRGAAGSVYNLGSEETISIAALAQRVATVLGAPGYEVLGRPDIGWNPGRYVPATGAIRRDLALAPRVGLDEAIRRTAQWHGWKA